MTEITSGTGWPFVHPGKPGPFRTWTSQSSNLSIVVFTPERKEKQEWLKTCFNDCSTVVRNVINYAPCRVVSLKGIGEKHYFYVIEGTLKKGRYRRDVIVGTL